ncbi:MAG: SpoIIE family protein phosphatase [Acidobacteriota bacterium]
MIDNGLAVRDAWNKAPMTLPPTAPEVRPASVAALLIGLALVLTLTSAASAAAPGETRVEISAKEINEEAGHLTLPPTWKFSPEDDEAFAARSFDDSDWSVVDALLRAESRPSTWQGSGWFRQRLRVSPDLRGHPLALTIHHFGAAEIYLDGELLIAAGDVDGSVPRLQRRPYLFSFDNRANHVFAIRYTNPEGDAYEAAGHIAGFELSLGAANRELQAYGQDVRGLSTFQALFSGLFAAFALLHLLFYVFYREAEENLYFAVLAGIVALLVYLFFHSRFTEDPRFFLTFERATNTAWLLLCLAALRFVYAVYQRPPQRLFIALAAIMPLAAFAWFRPLDARPWILPALLLTSVEMVRTVIVANLRKQAGARIVGLGILILAVGISIGLLANIGVLPSSSVTIFLIPVGSVLVLIVTMSIYLSRRFALTSYELRKQLDQVKALSEEQLKQAQRARDDEVQRRLLEAENRRQAEELEEARKLQLSMLPATLPTLPDLEIAAGMYTATEVGGDYYDFDVADDGTLTVAIGDATGHGMKAGTMVTATKSLFKAISSAPGNGRSVASPSSESDAAANGDTAIQEDAAELSQTLGRFGRALKRMNLHHLRMALTLVRFKQGRLNLAAAGMPPALVHRAASDAVEAIGEGGMPLGSLDAFPYRQLDLELQPGDTVLLMSDGFPERLNPDDEMLGYDNVTAAFQRAASTSPQAIIDRLVDEAETWASGTPANDDTTFVVLRMRHADTAGASAR